MTGGLDFEFFSHHHSEPCHEKTCFMLYANNKDTDQPALLHRLVSVFVIRCLNSIIPILAISKISRLYLVYVAEQAGLSLNWSLTPEDRFSRDSAHSTNYQ